MKQVVFYNHDPQNSEALKKYPALLLVDGGEEKSVLVVYDYDHSERPKFVRANKGAAAGQFEEGSA